MAEIVAQPLPPPVRLTAGETTALIDACRATLCVRLRETDTVTYANPREVTLFRLDRGVQVALFGMRPGRRLSIESYFGFVVARNHVPVGYGGGWVLEDASEIGVNIFDTFRGGESAFIFAQVLRTYRQRYGATRFAVDSYQFGAGNPEAIRSGAFWFYHRLGFRPTTPHLAALAEQEWAHIRADRSYRSPPSVLRRLARSELVFDIDPDRGTQPIDVKHIGLAVTGYIGRTYDGDRSAAERDARRRVRRILGVRRIDAWPEPEQAAFCHLAVLVATTPDLRTWPASARRSLALLMRSKGGPREAIYARRLQRHGPFIGALRDLAEAGREIEKRAHADGAT